MNLLIKSCFKFKKLNVFYIIILIKNQTNIELKTLLNSKRRGCIKAEFSTDLK